MVNIYPLPCYQVHAARRPNGPKRADPGRFSSEAEVRPELQHPALPLREEMHLRQQVQVLPRRQGQPATGGSDKKRFLLRRRQ
jgi:hypothetical protein